MRQRLRVLGFVVAISFHFFVDIHTGLGGRLERWTVMGNKGIAVIVVSVSVGDLYAYKK